MGRFDAGFQPAFKQIAVSLRVLLHDTRQCTSLLEHMGVKDRLQWISTRGVQPGNLLSTSALTRMKMVQEEQSLNISYEPIDPESCLQFGQLTTFEDWWTSPIIHIPNTGATYARTNIVRYVANKAGGAHVDAIPPGLRSLERENALGWSIVSEDDPDGVPLTISPVPATVRTIANEVQLSLDNQQALIDAALGR
jgi:hypothetical protein